MSEEFTEVYVIDPIWIEGKQYKHGEKALMPNSELKYALGMGRVSKEPLPEPKVEKKK